jgi:hypothetical protein
LGSFQCFDLLQVSGDNDVQGRLLGTFPGCFEPRDAEFAPFQFVALSVLPFKRLCGGDAG